MIGCSHRRMNVPGRSSELGAGASGPMVPGVSIDRTKPLYGQQATDPAPESPRWATVCLNRSSVAICMTASTQINDDHACTIERSSSTARLQVTSLNRTGQYTGTRVVLRLLLCVSHCGRELQSRGRGLATMTHTIQHGNQKHMVWSAHQHRPHRPGADVQ